MYQSDGQEGLYVSLAITIACLLNEFHSHMIFREKTITLYFGYKTDANTARSYHKKSTISQVSVMFSEYHQNIFNVILL